MPQVTGKRVCKHMCSGLEGPWGPLYPSQQHPLSTCLCPQPTSPKIGSVRTNGGMPKKDLRLNRGVFSVMFFSDSKTNRTWENTLKTATHPHSITSTVNNFMPFLPIFLNLVLTLCVCVFTELNPDGTYTFVLQIFFVF